MKKTRKRIYKWCGFGKNDIREGCHLIKFVNGDISPTLTTLVGFNLVVVETTEE